MRLVEREGPGGYSGGDGDINNPADGYGPGGGSAGWSGDFFGGKPDDLENRGNGAFATTSNSSEAQSNHGETYGTSLLVPLIGGSGGGGGRGGLTEFTFGGGGGGGALLIASNTQISFHDQQATNVFSVFRAWGGVGHRHPSQNFPGKFGNGSGGAFRSSPHGLKGILRSKSIKLVPAIEETHIWAQAESESTHYQTDFSRHQKSVETSLSVLT